MTTRRIALSVDPDVMPTVAAALAVRGIFLGATTTARDGVRCYNARVPRTFCITDPSDLSQHDLTILHALADGHSYEEIAGLLDLRATTVRNYAKRRLYSKLGARDRREAVAIAYRMGALNTWEAAA